MFHHTERAWIGKLVALPQNCTFTCIYFRYPYHFVTLVRNSTELNPKIVGVKKNLCGFSSSKSATDNKKFKPFFQHFVLIFFGVIEESATKVMNLTARICNCARKCSLHWMQTLPTRFDAKIGNQMLSNVLLRCLWGGKIGNCPAAETDKS